MEEDFQFFLESLKKASERIDEHYFLPKFAGSEDPKCRERVYCYELYHRLRCILGDGFPYKLDGELDKAGSDIIKKELKNTKPDFIVHVPGEMNKNLVVIEVKSVTSVRNKISGLGEDLKKLKKFLDKVKYYRAIMLIYGKKDYNLLQKIQGEIKKISEKRILLVWHLEPRKRMEVVER
jgi:Holliday junction resolvase